jgi:hypothetical protein
MRIEAFKAAHLERLRLQPAQAYFGREISRPEYASMLGKGPAFTALDGDVVLGCGGAAELWAGRGCVWSLISDQAGPHMLAIHRAVAGFIKQLPYRRIEALVDADFEAGHRWIRLLKFNCETPNGMAGFTPDGRNVFLYARTK